MTEYYDKPTRIGGSTSDGISPGWGKVRLRLGLKDGIKGVVLDLKDVFFLSGSPCNLISLALLNNHNIFHDNKNKTLYDLETKEVLAQAKQWDNSFLLQPLNLSNAAVNIVNDSGQKRQTNQRTGWKQFSSSFVQQSPKRQPSTSPWLNGVCLYPQRGTRSKV